MSFDYDIAIIGSGPGGYVAAIRAAQLKMKTVLIEKESLGGVCLNWGCIPTKALLKSAEVYQKAKEAKSYGIGVENLSVHFPEVVKRSRRVANANSKGVEFLMKKNGVEVKYGKAELQKDKSILIRSNEGKTDKITAKNVIIATGARPREIKGMEFDGEKIISSKEAMTLKTKPGSMAIVGAGAIGVEFAWFYATLGTKITLIEMMDDLLPGEDTEISAALHKSFKKTNIKVFTSTSVNALTPTENGVKLALKKGDQSEIIAAEKVLIAAGVQGNVESLGLEALGVEYEKSFIQVDQWYQTNVAGVFAIGDIIGAPLLAHVASHEGIVCVEKMAGLQTHPVNYNAIPGCTYAQPQVASIGLTEKAALKKGHTLKIGRFPYSASGKARAIGERDGLVKLIFDEKYGELLGAHIIGAEATELIAELGIAKSLESTAVELAKTMHAHPTLSEMIMEAAGDALGEAVHL
jgi:dihydrolipoamide dehydrogenase